MSKPFANLLSHIPPQPPRDPRILHGLNLKRAWTKGPLLFLVPFCLMFAFLPLIMMSDSQIRSERRATKGNLKSASGIVTKAGWQSAGNNAQGFQSYLVNYKFQDGKVTFNGKSIVYQGSPFANVKAGAKVPVLYAPEDPSLNGIAGEWGTRNVFPVELFFLFPLMFLFMFAPFTVWPLKRLFQARRMFKNGTLTSGRVVWVKRQNQFFFATPVGSNFEVFFTFTTDEGQAVRTSQSVDNDWLVNQLKPDDELTVVYTPRKPQQALFLEAFIE